MDRVENTNKCHYKFINCKTGKVVWEGDSPVLTQELAPYSIYGAVDKYDALIRRKYLEMHRKLWNWIADETERTHKCIDKLEAFKHSSISVGALILAASVGHASMLIGKTDIAPKETNTNTSIVIHIVCLIGVKMKNPISG